MTNQNQKHIDLSNLPQAEQELVERITDEAISTDDETQRDVTMRISGVALEAATAAYLAGRKFAHAALAPEWTEGYPKRELTKIESDLVLDHAEAVWGAYRPEMDTLQRNLDIAKNTIHQVERGEGDIDRSEAQAAERVAYTAKEAAEERRTEDHDNGLLLIGERLGARLLARHIGKLMSNPITAAGAMLHLGSLLADDATTDALMADLAHEYRPGRASVEEVTGV